jgi:hypothetical protein
MRHLPAPTYGRRNDPGRSKTMKTSLRATLLGVAALAVTAAPASAAPGFSLNLSSPSAATVGQPFVVQASGIDPIDQGAMYLEVDAILNNLVTSCPANYSDAEQLADASGGKFLAFSTPESFDSAGNFSNPLAFTPQAPGHVLFCGYTDDGFTDILATAATATDVSAPSSGSGGGGGGGSTQNGVTARPANVKKPHLTRSGKKLTCSTGSWSGSPTRYSYSWLVNGRSRAGAHGRSLAVTRKLRGHRVQCKVTASNAGGAASAVSSALHVR